MKKILFLISISVLLINSGCEKENVVTDLDPCKDVEYSGFWLLNKHSLNKYYGLEKTKSSEDWIVAKVINRNSNEESWLVFDKKTKTFQNYPAPHDYFHFEFNMDEILYSTHSGKLESLHLVNGTVRTIYEVSDKNVFSLNDFNSLNGHVYLLIKNKQTLQHSILEINLSSNSVETLLVTDKIKNTSNSYLFDEFIMPYLNTSGQKCIVVFFKNNVSSLLFAYSINVITNEEEYFENLGGVIYTDALKATLSTKQPFALVRYSDSTFIFNFQKNQRFLVSVFSSVSGRFVFSDNGNIYDGATGQIIQTYSKPSDYFQPKYFDQENNRLFYEHRSRLGILKIDIGCKSNQTSNYHSNCYIDFNRKTMYSFTTENEQTYLYEYLFN